MPSKPWKRAELEVAHLLGGNRQLRHTGGPMTKDKGDVVEGKIPGCDLPLFIEVKFRKKHGVLNWFKIADEKAPDKVSLLFLRQFYDGNNYVLLKWDDLMKILENYKKEEKPIDS